MNSFSLLLIRLSLKIRIKALSSNGTSKPVGVFGAIVIALLLQSPGVYLVIADYTQDFMRDDEPNSESCYFVYLHGAIT